MIYVNIIRCLGFGFFILMSNFQLMFSFPGTNYLQRAAVGHSNLQPTSPC